MLQLTRVYRGFVDVSNVGFGLIDYLVTHFAPVNEKVGHT